MINLNSFKDGYAFIKDDLSKVPIKAWVKDIGIDDNSYQQALNVAGMPFIFPHIALMPDVHYGKGSMVGSVIPTKGAIMPAAVGVDIGCGMRAQKLSIKIDRIENLSKLRSSIERSVPVGFNQHKEPIVDTLVFLELLNIEKNLFNKAMCQIGTLGGGNHFIEICHDENNDAWVLLHSGSRNIGKTLAEMYINKAKGVCKDYFINLPDPDLSYLVHSNEDFIGYIQALLWCQDYAKINRKTMMDLVLKDISYHTGISKHEITDNSDMSLNKYFQSNTSIDCHHNYTEIENHFGHNLWITRKGAVSAREGQLGIIPGSMGSRSYIVKGKGNRDSFCSCSHGAGRIMSRGEARKKISLEEHKIATNGIECRKDEDVLDESPAAYKDIDKVMAAQDSLVEIVHTLKQVICIKG
jgi:tRNA-splicing ligase RtcB